MKAFWLVLLLVAGAGGCSRREEAPAPKASVGRKEIERGPIKVIVEMTPAKPSLSDQPSLTVTIDADEGLKVTKLPFGKAIGTFQIRDFSEALPEVRAGRQILRQKYLLEPTAVGEQVIAPIPVSYVGPDGKSHTVESEALVVDVTTLLGKDVPKLADLRPEAGPVTLASRRRVGLWVAAAVTTVAGFFVLWLVRRRRQVAQAPALSPSELASRELEELLKDNPAGRGDFKTYFVELTAIVRRYIERTTRLRAPEQTTEEFLDVMRSHPAFDEDQKRKLKSFLQSADLVKFAGHEPSREDVDSSFERAREFVGLAARAEVSG